MPERRKRKKQPDVDHLQAYREKRNFEKTAEPAGGMRSPSGAPVFVVQKHAARRLHYDLRLEADGVLKSWAVPRGPSYDPAEKRLAVHVEDHPLEYADFEGLIAEHQYGAGTVMVWDRGTWEPSGDWEAGLDKGHLKFRLAGKKLRGEWSLVRIRGGGGGDEEFGQAARDNWLLIKHPDREAEQLKGYDVEEQEPYSVKTGRTMEQIAEQKTAYWEGTEAEQQKEHGPSPNLLPAPKGSEAPWPNEFFPQLATLVTRLPEGGRWISEIKFDGYRLIASIRNGLVTLTTRRNQDWTEKFSRLAQELSRLPVRSAILDGEVVVLNSDGTTNFQKLQNILKSENEENLVFFVFDLPYYQGRDQTDVPLVERKELLRQLLTSYGERIPSVKFSDHVQESGERVLRKACRYGVEGIIAKRADSVYVQKRSSSWVKKKCISRQEFVIGGYTEPKGGRSLFGSLLLGYYDKNHRLLYSGNVGTGFNEQSIREVYAQLKELEQEASPFSVRVDDARRREVHWVEPRLVAEVEFSEWTEGGHLRHPSFVGLREDRDPTEISREEEAPLPEEEETGRAVKKPARTRADNASASLPFSKASDKDGTTSVSGGIEEFRRIPVKLSNPDRMFYPEQGITKKDLAGFYLQVGELMLPELANRPLVLVRCPEGIRSAESLRQDCFFQKHLRDEIPEWIRTAPIEEKGTIGLYPVVDNLNGLLSLVQLGVLEIHMLGCRADDVDHPDRIIFDLDPAPEVSKSRLRDAALFISDWLINHDMRPFLKLTGGKGIHVVVPIQPALSWSEAKKLSRGIAAEMMRQKRDWFVITVTKRRRTGKILIDYLRNSAGASSIVPYSTRALPAATVALPVTADELTEGLLAKPFTVKEAIDWVRKHEDPWRTINDN